MRSSICWELSIISEVGINTRVSLVELFQHVNKRELMRIIYLWMNREWTAFHLTRTAMMSDDWRRAHVLILSWEEFTVNQSHYGAAVVIATTKSATGWRITFLISTRDGFAFDIKTHSNVSRNEGKKLNWIKFAIDSLKIEIINYLDVTDFRLVSLPTARINWYQFVQTQTHVLFKSIWFYHYSYHVSFRLPWYT